MMAGSFQTAGASARAAYQSFSWREYAPLLPILAAQWLFLVCGLNLGSAWGMAVAGNIARSIVGNAAFDYPGFLDLLPLTFSYVESATFIVLGAFALPFLISRVSTGLKSSRRGASKPGARIRGAFLPTFLALAGAFAVTYAWQLFVSRGLHSLVGAVLQGGFSSAVATWVVSVAVGYAITTMLMYVPVVAVLEDVNTGQALQRGFSEGIQRFATTYPFVLLLSLPPLLLQLVVQIGGSILSERTRPENIAYLLLLYVVLSTVSTYFAWSMATRYYHSHAEAA
ncbi:MAG TPA: hypothetical protein VI198_07495 [Candidatus Eisenbacteria bacterium]